MKLLLATIVRNKQGQAVPTEQTLHADPLRIGRGADCKLYLPDPRVALHHATMGLSDDGKCFIESAAGSVKVDGGFERSVRLKPGQIVIVGPFELTVLPTPETNKRFASPSWSTVTPRVTRPVPPVSTTTASVRG